MPNKGMKQTSVERIGRSQLIPSVRWTVLEWASGADLATIPMRHRGAWVRRVHMSFLWISGWCSRGRSS